MDDLQNKLNALKQIVIENCKNESFAYREWFVADHLILVEKIAMELCDIYKEADKEVVFALVWFHDFGKPIDENNERELTREKGIEAMKQVALPEEFIKKILEFWRRMEMKNEINIAKEAIEVQIVSTADGASHFVGKFYPSYFRDNPSEPMDAILQRIENKIVQDWEHKIVLPEIKEAFKDRYLKALEIIGKYPEKFVL